MMRGLRPGGAAFLFFFVLMCVSDVSAGDLDVSWGAGYSLLGSAGAGAALPHQATGMMAALAGVEQDGRPGDNDNDLLGPPRTIKDPFEPINRVFFHFNDKMYLWLLKPMARGYKVVVPKTARMGVSNFFYNLLGPVRMVNCMLQGKGEEAGYEFVRLFMNTTVGLGGLMDVAGRGMGLQRYDEDLGQTLGTYGAGPGFYIHWPFLGPSSGRDTLGMFGDGFLRPVHYLPYEYGVPVRFFDRVNEISFSIGDYEAFKRSALDPYISSRDAYFQHRENLIKK
jgi:phospholipid-binding lipoprotein MlaA